MVWRGAIVDLDFSDRSVTDRSLGVRLSRVRSSFSLCSPHFVGPKSGSLLIIDDESHGTFTQDLKTRSSFISSHHAHARAPLPAGRAPQGPCGIDADQSTLNHILR